MNYHQTKEDIEKELNWINASRKDPASFSFLYNKYFKSIYVFTYKRTDNEDIAADLTQQVFLKALLNIGKYEYKGLPFSAWLFRIATNEINYHFRQSGKMRSISIEDAGLNKLIDEMEENANSEIESQIINSFEKLSSEEISMLEMRFFEEKSFKELGYIMNITENNAKVKTYRILDKIKKMIKK